jgi:hypothetical protein
MPVTYGLLAEKYLAWVHNITIKNTACSDTTCLLQSKKVMVRGQEVDLKTLFSPIVIDRKAYVNADDLHAFLLYLDIRLAGIDLESYSYDSIDAFSAGREKYRV